LNPLSEADGIVEDLDGPAPSRRIWRLGVPSAL